MKNFSIYIVALLIGLLSLPSCNKFLERESFSQISPDDFFNSETNAQTAVIGAYRTMTAWYYYGESKIMVPEFSAQHVAHVSSYPEYVEYDEKRVRVDNPWSQNIWTAIYTTVNAANNIIQRVPEMEAGSISDENREQFTREGKFIRALCYFDIVRMWGNAPLKLQATGEDEDLESEGSTAEELYALIIDDLTDAMNLPNAYDNIAATKGRATGMAARALLAKVHLYTGNYAEAAALAEEVISSGGFSLQQNFSTIWTAENTAESIFELQFDEQAQSTIATRTNPTPSLLFFAKNESVFNLFDEEDARRDFTIYYNVDEEGRARYIIGKYRSFAPPTQNFPVIRLAELLLIHAEAQARIAGSVSPEAYASYEAVRNRAGLSTPDVTNFADLEAFITDIQREKRLEMMFEGEAWFDYCRTGLALTEMMPAPDENAYRYPVPQVERDVNPGLNQNPGY